MEQHWGQRHEINLAEVHDVALSANVLGFHFLANMLVQCRTGTPLQCPSCTGSEFTAVGFKWYDTGQRHILMNTTFRNCGNAATTSHRCAASM